MNIISIDPNTEFIAYAVMSSEGLKIIETGTHGLGDLTAFLDSKIKEFQCEGLAVEDYTFYGKVLNKYHMDTIKLIGVLQQYATMKGIKFWSFTKPDINKSISRNARSTKTEMQKMVRYYLGLKQIIRPQHVNDAVCVGIHCLNYWKVGLIKK